MIDEIKLFKSLSEATDLFLRPLPLNESDRLHVSLNDDATQFITRTYGEMCVDGEVKIGFASYHANNTWPARIPEKKRLVDFGALMLPATDTNALLIHSLWPSRQVALDDDARKVYEFLLTRFTHQLHGAVGRAREDAGSNGLLDRAEWPLATYQKIALVGAMNQEGFGLFMDPGTGKSAVIVARICNEAYDMHRTYRVLIVCPKNVRQNWKNEFIKFATTSGRLVILTGGKLERVGQIIRAHHDGDNDASWMVVICSYEAVSGTWEALQMCRWDLGVADESHFFKSTRTARYKKMMELRERCAQRICLTGTPSTNSHMDLYAQFEFMGEGLSGFSTFTAFKAFYGRYVRSPDGDVRLVGLQNAPLLKERLARLTSGITLREALPYLPDHVYDIVEVEMTKKQGQVYRALAKHLLAEIDDDLSKGGPRQIVIRHALTKLLRLSQITAGFAKTTEVDPTETVTNEEIYYFDPNPKMDAVISMLKEKGPADKTVIWSCWVPVIKMLKERTEAEGIDAVTYFGQTNDRDRDIAEARFAGDPSCKVLIGNPSAGGVGLNFLGYSKESDLTNCTHVIYYVQDWSMVHRTQSERRSLRLGTRVSVRYTDVVVLNTIDDKIRMRVMNKRLDALKIADLREILAGLAAGDDR